MNLNWTCVLDLYLLKLALAYKCGGFLQDDLGSRKLCESCGDLVLAKEHPDNCFALLSCDHVFCLPCARTLWAQTSSSVSCPPPPRPAPTPTHPHPFVIQLGLSGSYLAIEKL